MRALGQELRTAGFRVEATRDFENCPFILEISRDDVFHSKAWGGKRRQFTVILAEVEDDPTILEINTAHLDPNNHQLMDLTDPQSVEKLIKLLRAVFDEQIGKS